MVKSHYDIINKAIKRTSREKVTHQLLSFAKKHPSKKTYAVKLARATYFGAQRSKLDRIVPPVPTPVTSPYSDRGSYTLLPPPAPQRKGGVKILPKKDEFYDARSSPDVQVKSAVTPTPHIQTTLDKQEYSPKILQKSDVAGSEEYRKAVEQARELNQNVELLKTNVSELKTRQEKLKELNGTLTTQRDRLRTELAQKTSEIQRLKTAEAANKERIAQLTTERDAEKRKLEETELQLANVKRSLDAEKAAQTTGLEKMTELQNQLAAAEERYTSEMENMQRAQGEAIQNANREGVQRLEAALANKEREWQADRGVLSNQIQSEKDKAARIGAELKQLKDKYKALSQAKNEVDEKLKSLDERLKQERALKETSEGLARRLSKEVSDKERQLTNIRTELTRSNGQLEQLKVENGKLSEQAAALARQLDIAKKSGQGNNEVLNAMILLNNMNAESSIEYKSAFEQYDNDIAKINKGIAGIVSEIATMSKQITTSDFGKKSKAARGKKQPTKKAERKKPSERSGKRK